MQIYYLNNNDYISTLYLGLRDVIGMIVFSYIF
jgi:hypothetical protein